MNDVGVRFGSIEVKLGVEVGLGLGVWVEVGVAIKMRSEQTKHYICLCMRVFRIRHTVCDYMVYGIRYMYTYTIWYRGKQTTCGGLVADL